MTALPGSFSARLHHLLSAVASAAEAALPIHSCGFSRRRQDGLVDVMAGGRQHQFAPNAYPDIWPAPGQTLLREGVTPALPFLPAEASSLLASGVDLGPDSPAVLWFTFGPAPSPPAGIAEAILRFAHLLDLVLMPSFENEAQRKWSQLEALLPAIAEALDIQTVFPRLSSLIQPVLPHVTLSLALLTPDRLGVRLHVASNYEVAELPIYRFTSESERLGLGARAFIAYDCAVIADGVVRARVTPAHQPPAFVELRPGSAWTQLLANLNVRSLLRVPVHVHGEVVGGISFGSAQPFAYAEEDIVFAARIADHVALALAHQCLADEVRRAAQAEERAALLQQRMNQLVGELESRGSHRALGESAAWKLVLRRATQVAGTGTTVLLTGESGTGKEVIARLIHRGSSRASAPFVAVNCAALPETLLESELFGYERGAFTGAMAAKPGKLEQAAGGVLFLDEVGEMSDAVQAKFLRVLQEREFQRLGGTRTLGADIRVIAATNRDPRTAIERGALRADLYYRLGVFEIHLPALRERADDIPLLAEAFLTEIAATVGRPAAGFSADAREHLLRYAWPGNIRELRNAIERAVILCEGGMITPRHLLLDRESIRPAQTPGAAFPPGGVSLPALERDWLERALLEARNNKSAAAKLLGITRGQLYSLLQRHNLTSARR